MINYNISVIGHIGLPLAVEFSKKFKTVVLDIDKRIKQGFEIPLSNWLKNDLKFRQLYFDTLLSRDSIFNNSYVKQLFTGQFRGYHNSEKILGILIFEFWRKKYSIKLN